MKQIAILILTVLGCVHTSAQSNVIDSAEMKELMKIIELQQRIGSAPDTNDRYDGIYIRKGQNHYGEILFHVDGKWIRKGQNPYGQILYTVDGNWIRKGQNPYGEILYHIDGKWIRKGQNPYG
jgi:hypothetical protein